MYVYVHFHACLYHLLKHTFMDGLCYIKSKMTLIDFDLCHFLRKKLNEVY